MPILADSVRIIVRTRVTILVFALFWSCVLGSAQSSGKKLSQNQLPTLTLTANPTSLCYGGQVKLFADAHDPDGDKLTYTYTTRFGRIIGEGRNVRWQLSGVGEYDVKVEVSDGHGGLASSSTSIIVWEMCGCPSLMIDGSFNVLEKKPSITFRLGVSGSEDMKPTYFWRVSSGKIIRGKRSPTITVDVTGVEADDVTATVKVGNLAPECDRERTFTVKNPSHQSP